jgi:hypothetical protein
MVIRSVFQRLNRDGLLLDLDDTSSPEVDAKEGQCAEGEKGSKGSADDYTRGYDARR